MRACFLREWRYYVRVEKGVITMLILAGLLLIACRTTGSSESSMRSTKVDQARKKLADLNATQNEVTKKLIEKRNLLLSMPKDSPPTREISRQLALLNKQATELVSQVFVAELALEAAFDAEAEEKTKAEDKEALGRLLRSSMIRSNTTASGTNPSAQPVAVSAVLRLHPFQIVLDENSGTRSVTGEVENTSTNAVTDVTVVFKLVDDRDESAGTVSDFIARIEGESRWAFKALVLDENAKRAKFMELKGDELKGIPALPGSDPDPE